MQLFSVDVTILLTKCFFCPDKHKKYYPQKYHTCGGLICFLCSPDCPKQPRIEMGLTIPLSSNYFFNLHRHKKKEFEEISSNKNVWDKILCKKLLCNYFYHWISWFHNSWSLLFCDFDKKSRFFFRTKMCNLN